MLTKLKLATRIADLEDKIAYLSLRVDKLECKHRWIPHRVWQVAADTTAVGEWRVAWYCTSCGSYRYQPLSELTDAHWLALRQLGFYMPEEKG